MRAAIYTRVSNKEAAKGFSLDVQRTTLERWAELEGWAVVEHYEDAGISAKDLELVHRPAFTRALEDAGTVYDLLLVLKQDRFARNIADAYDAKRRLQRVGARVLYYNERAANEESPSGRMMEAVGYAASEGYVMDLSRKTRDAYALMATEQGLHVGDVPFGYRGSGVTKTPMELEPAEAEAVRWMYETYVTGAWSQMAIADELTRRGLRPHSKQGRTAWGAATVGDILKNRVYLGEVQYKGEWYPGAHRPLVTEDLFNRVRLVAQRRNSSPEAHKSNPRHHYMLSGISSCQCGSALWASTSGSRLKYYRCSSRYNGGDCQDRRRGLRADLAERRVERAILDTAARIPHLEELIADEVSRMAPPDADAERARLKGVIARATRLGMLGGDEEQVAHAIRSARQALAALDAPPRAAVAVGTMTRFLDLWPHFSPGERKEAARTMFQEVKVNIGRREIFFRPQPEYAAAYLAAAQQEDAMISHVQEKVVLVDPRGLESADTTLSLAISGVSSSEHLIRVLWLRVA